MPKNQFLVVIAAFDLNGSDEPVAVGTVELADSKKEAEEAIETITEDVFENPEVMMPLRQGYTWKMAWADWKYWYENQKFLGKTGEGPVGKA